MMDSDGKNREAESLSASIRNTETDSNQQSKNESENNRNQNHFQTIFGLIGSSIAIVAVVTGVIQHAFLLPEYVPQLSVLSFIIGTIFGMYSYCFSIGNRKHLSDFFNFKSIAIFIVVTVSTMVLIALFQRFATKEIQIISPSNEIVEEPNPLVEGIARNLRKDEQVLLFVYYSNDKTYYTQDLPKIIDKSRWEGTVRLTYGNTEYDIYAVVVKKREWRLIEEKSSFKTFPFDSDIYDFVHVKRE